MRPVEPIIPGHDLPVVVFAKDQPEYLPLPAYRSEDGVVFTRWHMTWRERLRAFWRGDVYLEMHTFNRPLQPVMLHITPPEVKVLA